MEKVQILIYYFKFFPLFYFACLCIFNLHVSQKKII